MEVFRMPVNLSIKNVPDDVAERLRERARRNHRSLQGELLSIIEDAVRIPRQMTVEEVRERVRALGIKSTGDSTAIIRADRDRDERR
jgi:plasmid stability protein